MKLEYEQDRKDPGFSGVMRQQFNGAAMPSRPAPVPATASFLGEGETDTTL